MTTVPFGFIPHLVMIGRSTPKEMTGNDGATVIGIGDINRTIPSPEHLPLTVHNSRDVDKGF